jgi:hypothetical protein
VVFPQFTVVTLHYLQKIADIVVPDGWHTTVAALVEFTGGHLPAAVLVLGRSMKLPVACVGNRA